MKTNAIIRIITWSLVIVVLLGILSAGINLQGIFRRWEKRLDNDPPAATHAPEPVDTNRETEETVPWGSTYYVKETTNIRAKPSPMAEVRGAIQAGESARLTREEMIDGRRWGYITEPEQGWILLDENVEKTEQDPVPPAETSASEYTGGYGVDASDISDISIEWAAGSITIIPVEGSRILVEESGSNEASPMVIGNKKGKLKIEYCEENLRLGFSTSEKKDLTIQLPKDFLLQELEIEAASAAVRIEGANIREVDFEGASGTCDFLNCSIQSLDMETASGDVTYDGTLETLDFEGASASFTGKLTNVPKRLKMESMSGNLDVTLPKEAGFTAALDGMKNKFTSDFETTLQDGAYVCGDGVCRIKMSAMSGELTVRKGS